MNARQHVFNDTRFELHFSYPTTVDDHVVEIAEEVTEESITWRFTSNARRDLYFEISRFANANAEERYTLLKERSQHSDELSIGDAEIITLAGQPSLAFDLQRGELQRRVILIQRKSCFYRITYNPLHPANQKILETVEFTIC